MSCPGSPHSNCGSVCDHEDGSRHHSFRCKKCRRATKYSDKHSTEHMNVHFSDQVSLQSFQAEDAVLDLPMGKHDIDCLSEMCNEELEDLQDSDEKLDCNEKSHRLPLDKNHGSVELKSTAAVILTDVESDKPVFVVPGCKYIRHMEHCDNNLESTKPNSTQSLSQRSDSSNSSNDIVVSLNSCASAMSMKYCKYDKNGSGERTLSKCRSEEIYKKKKNSIDQAVSEKSKSEEIFNKEEVTAIGGSMRRTRRESCELAMQNGRISPVPKQSTHL